MVRSRRREMGLQRGSELSKQEWVMTQQPKQRTVSVGGVGSRWATVLMMGSVVLCAVARNAAEPPAKPASTTALGQKLRGHLDAGEFGLAIEAAQKATDPAE